MSIIGRQIDKAYRAARSLIVYRSIINDDIVKDMVNMLITASNKSQDPAVITYYYELFSKLVEKSNQKTPSTGNLWQNHLLDLVLNDENAFSLKCEKSALEGVDKHLKELVKRDLAFLKTLFDFDFSAFTSLIKQHIEEVEDFPPMCVIKGSDDYPFPKTYFREKQYLKELLQKNHDWTEKIEELASFYKKVGCGKFGRYWAFKWVGNGQDGKLVGIPKPDSIRLKDLIGYEEQKKEVIRNTRQFIHGFGANNMLLYGDRGTGKSSTIKALVNEFGEEGLRIVEVTKDQLTNLSGIIAQLRDRPYRYIIFVDDLSFEEHETEYKYLKAVLEGSLEPAPENVLIYATSNRRHLIREYHSDRKEDELKAQDTLQEKLSLSDRFGITIIYLSPDQEKYLEIVEGIAKSKGINIEPEKLRQLAIKWELWHNSRSGRTAKQFIEDLLGKMAYKTYE